MSRSVVKYVAAMVVMAVFAVTGHVSAQTTDAAGMDWATNLATPAVPPKASASVARHIETISKWFKNNGFDTRFVRNNEVLVVTIPASDLFGPNLTDMIAGAAEKLNVFERAIVHPESYRILVAAFADDTGDDTYSIEMTRKRATAVKDVLDKIGARKGVKPNIYSYWFGREKPLVPNNSIANRAKNRRIEIYIIPEKRTVDNARSGRLS